MNYKNLKLQLAHQEDLLDSAINELTFANMQVAFLYNALNEIGAITDDKLLKEVIENYKRKRRTEIIAINDYSDYEVLLHRLAALHPRANVLVNSSHSSIIMDDI